MRCPMSRGGQTRRPCCCWKVRRWAGGRVGGWVAAYLTAWTCWQSGRPSSGHANFPHRPTAPPLVSLHRRH